MSSASFFLFPIGGGGAPSSRPRIFLIFVSPPPEATFGFLLLVCMQSRVALRRPNFASQVFSPGSLFWVFSPSSFRGTCSDRRLSTGGLFLKTFPSFVQTFPPFLLRFFNDLAYPYNLFGEIVLAFQFSFSILEFFFSPALSCRDPAAFWSRFCPLSLFLLECGLSLFFPSFLLLSHGEVFDCEIAPAGPLFPSGTLFGPDLARVVFELIFPPLFSPFGVLPRYFRRFLSLRPAGA